MSGINQFHNNQTGIDVNKEMAMIRLRPPIMTPIEAKIIPKNFMFNNFKFIQLRYNFFIKLPNYFINILVLYEKLPEITFKTYIPCVNIWLGI